MNDQTIKAIVEELAPALVGRRMGKVFHLSRLSVAVDFRPGDGRYLFLSVEPASPRIYLIERRVRDLEKQALAPTPFILVIRKHLSGAVLVALAKDEGDRIVRFSFNSPDDLGETRERILVAQLTGKTSNLLLLDERGLILDTLRPSRGEGQTVGERYVPPPKQAREVAPEAPLTRGGFTTLSKAADDFYSQLEATRAFDARAAAVLSNLRKEISRREKLRRHLSQDIKDHGDAEEHKRIGDLLLANLGSAKRRGDKVTLTDYYAEGAPSIELEVDENSTLQEEAARRFTRYAKAKRAAREITERLATLEQELKLFRDRQAGLEQAIKSRNEAALENFGAEKKAQGRRKQTGQKSSPGVPGARQYRSSDGYEILVGRASRDNDHLTFRVARPHDLWLHAADYPGSHVVVRNHMRGKDIPHRTIIEAAQLAAHFSQARTEAKVNVHYTQRKFLSKPKGAAPGLVRMSSFKTLTVAPQEGVERI